LRRESRACLRTEAGAEARGSWLIDGDAGHSNPSKIATGLLKFDAYCPRNKKMGETMNTHITHSAKYPVCRRAMAKHDFLMVSAFGVWALLLGLSPVLVFHALT
jgi:hypothetical protein